MEEIMKMLCALLIIDVQEDFCEGGVLPARDTLSLIQPLNELIYWAVSKDIACIYTRDWHPPDHCSFITQGGQWQVHCVQNTSGAQFAAGIVMPDSANIIDIGTDSIKINMSYSAFENTELKNILNNLQINNLIVTGIATEYCVKATALDALRFGYHVTVLTDLIRLIDIQPDDSIKAIEEMKTAGVKLTTSIEFLKDSNFGY
jgi:nicotinamidase/pyrazinamidase